MYSFFFDSLSLIRVMNVNMAYISIIISSIYKSFLFIKIFKENQFLSSIN